MAAPELTLAEHVCLALVDEGAAHGWAIGTLLAPDGEIGRIWTLSRPLTYRAIEQLDAKGLVRRREDPTASGRARQTLRITARGRRVVHEWLVRPVAHLRDVRTELLLKLELRRRAGLDPAPLVAAQRAAFAERVKVLQAGARDDDVVSRWRAEHALAVERFLDALHGGAGGGGRRDGTKSGESVSAPRHEIEVEPGSTVTLVVRARPRSTRARR